MYKSQKQLSNNKILLDLQQNPHKGLKISAGEGRKAWLVSKCCSNIIPLHRAHCKQAPIIRYTTAAPKFYHLIQFHSPATPKYHYSISPVPLKCLFSNTPWRYWRGTRSSASSVSLKYHSSISPVALKNHQSTSPVPLLRPSRN